MFSVNTILTFFSFMVRLLKRRAAKAEARFHTTNHQISSLIVQREQHATEQARAQGVAKKLNELIS